MQILKAGTLYFGFVFGAGLLLGAIRTLLMVPKVGQRNAELIESPIMLVVTIFAAKWISIKLLSPATVQIRLYVGLLALALLLLAELAVTKWIQRLTIRQYIATRDPISGSVYLLLLAVFAAMPVLLR